jgi:hypothetical protein
MRRQCTKTDWFAGMVALMESLAEREGFKTIDRYPCSFDDYGLIDTGSFGVENNGRRHGEWFIFVSCCLAFFNAKISALIGSSSMDRF